jgi:hypothetical protein
MGDEDAFGEMDVAGKSNIGDFQMSRCSFEYMPVEGRVYSVRRAELRDRGWSSTWELRMGKSRAEMMELLGKLLVEYAKFQRRRPDLPQGDLRDLSERNWRS